MKTFKLFGAALLAVMLSVGFTSCSEGDGPGGKGAKKLVKVVASSGNHSEELTLSYDKSGHLVSAYIGDVCRYEWSGDTIVETEDDDAIIYDLFNGLIVSSKDDDSKVKFSYNSSKQLASIVETENGMSSSETQTISWEGDQVSKVVREDEFRRSEMKFTYEGQTCKGYNPLFGVNIYDDTLLAWAQPELFGLRANQLVTKIVQTGSAKTQGTVTYDEVYEFTYTLDNKGYITSCVVKNETTEKLNNGQSDHWVTSSTFTFTWK